MNEKQKMKRKIGMTAEQARRWMVENPGKECIENGFRPCRFSPATFLFEWEYLEVLE